MRELMVRALVHGAALDAASDAAAAPTIAADINNPALQLLVGQLGASANLA
ncbi:MAG: hypothetical protein WAL25_03980 [Acidimicrobiia bacterium]